MRPELKTFLWILAHIAVATIAVLFALKQKEKFAANDEKRPQPSLFNQSKRVADPRF